MRVSFDLDDTLICYQDGALYEPNCVPLLLRPWFSEPLRLGTRELCRELKRRNCDLCVYTTSLRSPAGVRRWLGFYGIRVDRVINADEHDRQVRARVGGRRPSKNPRHFGIDLHIDNSTGVGIEGKEHGFDVVVVDPGDSGWTDQVLVAVDQKSAAAGD